MMNTNLLDLNNDILNIIGDYVKKDNAKRQIMKEKQIINGKEIRFCPYPYWSLYGFNGDTFSKLSFLTYLPMIFKTSSFKSNKFVFII